MTPLVICFAVFVCVSALVGGAVLMFRGDASSMVEDRLAVLTGTQSSKQSGSALVGQSLLAHPLESGHSLVESIMSRFNLGLLFEQADINLSVQKFMAISGLLCFAGIVGGGLAQLNPVVTLVIGATCAILPLLAILFRRKRRFKAFERQLPDALELVARALRAGHSLASGLHLVYDEMTDPIRKEFGRAFEEQNLGIPLEQALDNMTARIPNLDLRFFATAVILQRQTGGDLAEILDKIGTLVRERFKIHGQVQALTGEGRLSGVVLLALPPVLFVVVYRMNPDYVMPLFTDPFGKQMLIVGLVMQLLGALVIRKIVNIKV